MLNKNSWYYENTVTGEISSQSYDAGSWADFDGVDVNCWHWSEFSQEWEIWMVREGRPNGYQMWPEDFYTGM